MAFLPRKFRHRSGALLRRLPGEAVFVNVGHSEVVDETRLADLRPRAEFVLVWMFSVLNPCREIRSRYRFPKHCCLHTLPARPGTVSHHAESRPCKTSPTSWPETSTGGKA